MEKSKGQNFPLTLRKVVFIIKYYLEVSCSVDRELSFSCLWCHFIELFNIFDKYICHNYYIQFCTKVVKYNNKKTLFLKLENNEKLTRRGWLHPLLTTFTNREGL